MYTRMLRTYLSLWKRYQSSITQSLSFSTHCLTPLRLRSAPSRHPPHSKVSKLNAKRRVCHTNMNLHNNNHKYARQTPFSASRRVCLELLV